MGQLWLTYNERRYGGEAIDPGDRWTSHEPETIEFYPTGLFLERPNEIFAHQISDEGYEEHQVDNFEVGDNCWLVVVRYGTGSTFGHIDGAWTIIGAYKDSKDAVEVEKTINDDTYEGYKCWSGYFETLQGVEITPMFIRH